MDFDRIENMQKPRKQNKMSAFKHAKKNNSKNSTRTLARKDFIIDVVSKRRQERKLLPHKKDTFKLDLIRHQHIKTSDENIEQLEETCSVFSYDYYDSDDESENIVGLNVRDYRFCCDYDSDSDLKS